MTNIAIITPVEQFYRVTGDGIEYVRKSDVSNGNLNRHLSMKAYDNLEIVEMAGARLVDEDDPTERTPWFMEPTPDKARAAIIDAYDLCPVCMQWVALESDEKACRIYHETL